MSGNGLFGKPGMRDVLERDIASRLDLKNKALLAMASKSLYDARNAKTVVDMRAVSQARKGVEAAAVKLAAAIYKAAAHVRNVHAGVRSRLTSRQLAALTKQRVRVGGNYTAVVHLATLADDDAEDGTALWLYFTDASGVVCDFSQESYLNLVRGAWRLFCPGTCTPSQYAPRVPKASVTFLNSVLKRASDMYMKNPVKA